MWTIYGNKNSENTIVAIPALGERKEMFQALANEINDYKWIAFDLPGSNKEQLPDYSIVAFCKSINEILMSLRIEKAHFIGNSLGAWIIQAYTSAYPHTVQSLTLLDGGHYFLGERNEEFEIVELPSSIVSFEDIQEAVNDLTYSMPHLLDHSYEYFKHYFLQNYILVNNFYTHHCDEVAYNALSKEILTKDYCLQQTTIPMHLVIAEASADEISVAKTKLFQQKFLHAQVTYIENGQHYLPLTNTFEVAEVLTHFYMQWLDSKIIQS